jgi:Winged helix DNA-binding domain
LGKIVFQFTRKTLEFCFWGYLMVNVGNRKLDADDFLDEIDSIRFSAIKLERIIRGGEQFESPNEEQFLLSKRKESSDQESYGQVPAKRSTRTPLPDPRLIRRIIRNRQLRGRFLHVDLFADPAWDMLLDLTAARAEHKRVSVTSLCIASCVPPTTALRWVGLMTEMGLLDRVEDDSDRRRSFVALSDKAADAMARYFAELGRLGQILV